MSFLQARYFSKEAAVSLWKGLRLSAIGLDHRLVKIKKMSSSLIERPSKDLATTNFLNDID